MDAKCSFEKEKESLSKDNADNEIENKCMFFSCGFYPEWNQNVAS